MGFSNETWHPNCLSCTPHHAVALRKAPAATHPRKSVSQPKRLLFWKSLIAFQSHYIPFCFVLFQAHSHLHHCIRQAPTRKQEHTDDLKQRKFNAGNWLHVMKEAEKPTGVQTVNPEISNFGKLPPPLGRGRILGGLPEPGSHQKKLKDFPNLPVVLPIDQTSRRPADTQSLQKSVPANQSWVGRGKLRLWGQTALNQHSHLLLGLAFFFFYSNKFFLEFINAEFVVQPSHVTFTHLVGRMIYSFFHQIIHSFPFFLWLFNYLGDYT